MASNSAEECGVCNEDFDEEVYCPRILPCTHCICADCINRLIRDNKRSCPFCRQEFQGRSARDFGRNIKLIELLQYIADLKLSKPSAGQKKSNSPKSLSDLKSEKESMFNASIADLQETKDKVQNAIQGNKLSMQDILKDIRYIENKLLGSINDILSNYHEKIDHLRVLNNSMHSILKFLKKEHQEITDCKGQFLAAQTYGVAGQALDRTELIITVIKEQQQRASVLFSNNEKVHKYINEKTEESKEKLQVVHEVLRTINAESNITFVKIDPCALQILFKKHISPKNLKSRDDCVIHLIKTGKLFAIQQLYGIRRSAKLSLNEDKKFYLHCLREGPPPTDAFVINHMDILRMVDPTSRMTFLEISAKGSTLGKLAINLLPTLKLADQFYTLCTGELGHSHVNSAFLRLMNKGTAEERVAFGDYVNNDSTSEWINSLIPGIKKEGGKSSPWFAGALEGVWYSEDFMSAEIDIYTKDNSSKVLEAVFGKVEKGLTILTNAISKNSSVQELSVKDCGIILPW